MQVCTSLQTDNHASTPLLSFLQAGCPSCRPTNSIKALKANSDRTNRLNIRTASPGAALAVCAFAAAAAAAAPEQHPFFKVNLLRECTAAVRAYEGRYTAPR